jgi:OXA1/YqjG-like inner membrane protein
VRSSTAKPLAPASLSQRLLASLISLSVALAATAVAGVVAYRLRARLPPLKRLIRQRLLQHTGRPFELSRPRRCALWAVSLLVSVWGRNWRGPGARILRLRKVDAMTDGPVSVRSAVIDFVAGAAWLGLVKRLFSPAEMRHRERLRAVNLEMTELHRRYADDREALQPETVSLYRKHGVSPARSCLRILPRLVLSELPRLWSPLHQGLAEQLAGTVTVEIPEA